jgi:hypothetical protein
MASKKRLVNLKAEYNTQIIKLSDLKTEVSNAPEIFKLYGYIIALTDTDDVYEIAKTTYDSRYRRRIPTSRHALLIAKTTTFTTKGSFTMDVVALKTVPITLKKEFGSFNQNWIVYKEATYEDRKPLIQLDTTQKECKNLIKLIDNCKKDIATLKFKYNKYLKLLHEYNAIEQK